MFRLTPVITNLGAAFSILFPLLAIAAGDESRLPEMVISATRTQSDIRDVPASVTVIDKKRIEQSAATTVDQLVSGVPGIYAARMDASAPNRIAQVYARGMPGNGRTLVLVDGVPMNVNYDGQVDWSQLATRDVERIEVVRGGSSGLYGGNAMGGVINVFSQTPKPGTEYKVSANYGTNNTQSLDASYSSRTGPTALYLSGSSMKSDGYNMWTQATKLAAGANAFRLINIGSEKNNFTAKLSHEVTDRDLLDFSVSYLDDLSTGFYTIPNYLPQERKQLATSARYRHFTDNTESSLVAYGRFGNQQADSTAAPYTTISYRTETDDKSYGANALTTITLSKSQRLSVGADYQDGQITTLYRRYAATPGRSTDVKGSAQRLGVFIQDELKLGASWIFNLAGRLDRWATSGSQTDTLAGQPVGTYNERTGTVFSPKFGALYKLAAETNVRATAGRSFKMPELWELYSSNKRGATTFWGNPNLEPETVNAYDLGIDQYFGDQAYIKATAYRNNAKNFVYSVTRNATNNDKVNVEGVVTKGLELEAMYKPLSYVNLSGSFTLNKSTITESVRDSALVGKELIYVPKKQGQLRADFDLPQQTTLFVVSNYVGNRWADDKNTSTYRNYTTYDIGISRKFTEGIVTRLTVANMFNNIYDGIGYLAPGRLVTAGITAKF